MAQKEKQSSVMEDVKRSIGKAADLTSLKIKLGQTKAKRKNAYARLGELAYTTYRPRTDAVTEDIEKAIGETVEEITALSHSILELELRIKLLKAEL